MKAFVIHAVAEKVIRDHFDFAALPDQASGPGDNHSKNTDGRRIWRQRQMSSTRLGETLLFFVISRTLHIREASMMPSVIEMGNGAAATIDVTIVMPCLNEAKWLPACIANANVRARRD